MEQKLRELYVLEGKSRSEIANEFDISMSSVRAKIRKYGIIRPSEVKFSEEKLRKLYEKKRMTIDEICDELDASRCSIRRHMNHYSIERNHNPGSDWMSEPKRFATRTNGYEVWSGKQDVLHHRLLAVAEYGIEEVKGKDVHHKNGIKWDNRPENIEVKCPKKHIYDHWHETPIYERLIEMSDEEIEEALRATGREHLIT